MILLVEEELQKTDMSSLTLWTLCCHRLSRGIGTFYVDNDISLLSKAENNVTGIGRSRILDRNLQVPQDTALRFATTSCGFLRKYATMRGRNLKPSRVYQIATLLLESKSISQAPPWYTTIGSIPPSEILTRTQPAQYREPTFKSRAKKPSKVFRPLPIDYEEDALRKQFFSDHPWELARPRIVLEDDGRDGQKVDWSRIQQKGRPLNGESVVQRQLWLINHGGMSSTQAYDVARKEFYALRQGEEVERRVAKEEAMAVGAYFGKSALEVGMELEDKTYEKWKEWATNEVAAIERQRDAAYTGVGTANEDDGSSLLPVDADEEPALV